MKDSYIYVLIANLWVMLAWLVEGTFETFACIFLGVFWLVGYVIMVHQEHKLWELENKLDFLNRKSKELDYMTIVSLLKQIAGKKNKGGRKKK